MQMSNISSRYLQITSHNYRVTSWQIEGRSIKPWHLTTESNGIHGDASHAASATVTTTVIPIYRNSILHMHIWKYNFHLPYPRNGVHSQCPRMIAGESCTTEAEMCRMRERQAGMGWWWRCPQSALARASCQRAWVKLIVCCWGSPGCAGNIRIRHPSVAESVWSERSIVNSESFIT